MRNAVRNRTARHETAQIKAGLGETPGSLMINRLPIHYSALTQAMHCITMYSAMQRNGSNRDGQWEAQLRKGSLDLAILAVLWDGRLYGLEILRRLQDGPGLELAEGTLYPILMRLKNEGLLKSEWVEADAGHPRKYYWLTATGRQRARDMAKTWNDFSQSVAGLLARVTNKE